MMKRYKIGNNYHWYEEGTQPACAVEDKPVKEAKVEDTTSVTEKAKTPSNKGKGVKNK